ncbi:MAG TPA: aminotransferase class I/II-fold pyridoxal phosphate-dependent enzyme [Bryobacteraceae bacterium]|nr:aminotransferase class I/II-fold pyridoxal phosphate-dependent enzyme [Bryobacteraceae bacterium]
MLLEQLTPALLTTALRELENSFSYLPPMDNSALNLNQMEAVMSEVAERMGDNYPYFHPLYAGQMLKPPHPIARAAYALATWINPNNHALDGGRASSAMEKESVAALAAMFGWQTHLGHLTGGGTMANLEALWVAGQLQPGKKIIASAQAHYTHERISGVLQLPFEKVAVDERGRMDIAALEQMLSRGDVGCVVATLGTTGVGSVDPLEQILRLRERFGFRIHVDAAYGGYFSLTGNLAPEARSAFDCMPEADSIVIDPHKHGLQPYGCGCVLFRDPAAGSLYKHHSPYTYFSSSDLHLGEISLECSRPGAAAVALWATQRLLPLARGGEFAKGLESSRRAALALAQRLKADERFVLPFDPELDIVVWARRAASASAASALAQQIFNEAAKQQLHLALIHLPVSFFRERWPELQADTDDILCLRSVLMKAEHEAWVGRIYNILSGLS